MTTWSVRQQSQLRFELCDDAWLVYAEGSGRSHLVDFLFGEVLLFLATADRDDEALAGFVAGQLGDREVPVAAVIAEVLQPLVGAGLVEERQRF